MSVVCLLSWSRLQIQLVKCVHRAWVWQNVPEAGCLSLVAMLEGAWWTLFASPPAALVEGGQTCRSVLVVVVSEVGGGDVVLC